MFMFSQTVARVILFRGVYVYITRYLFALSNIKKKCFSAHGKRSGKPPAAAPDWYVSRLLRRMAASAEMVKITLFIHNYTKYSVADIVLYSGSRIFK